MGFLWFFFFFACLLVFFCPLSIILYTIGLHQLLSMPCTFVMPPTAHTGWYRSQRNVLAEELLSLLKTSQIC